MIAKTPPPPYYAVIFSTLTTQETKGYEQMADRMVELASKQNGFLGIESAREGLGITVSYWKDVASIKAWKENSEHAIARKIGKEKWYAEFKLRIAKVERDFDFKAE